MPLIGLQGLSAATSVINCILETGLLDFHILKPD
jgi:hypothetical protein